MEISMWTSYFMEQKPEEMVETFAERGWRHLELSDEHGWELLRRGNPHEAGEKFQRFADSHGVSFPQGHLYLKVDIGVPDVSKKAETLDVMKQWLDLFVAIGIRCGVLHPGSPTPWRAEMLAKLVDHVRGSCLALCLENCRRGGLEEILEILDALDSAHTGICFDTGHWNLHREGRSFSEFIQKAGKRLKALHIADNLGTNDDHMLPYGKGTVPWEEVMVALRSVGYNGLFNYEVPGERRCPLPIKLAKLEYAKKLAEEMLRT